MKDPRVVYAKFAPNTWNRNVPIAFQEYCNIAGLVMLDGNAENKKKIVRILKVTLVEFKVVYNFGDK
jgi:hypothetical protein